MPWKKRPGRVYVSGVDKALEVLEVIVDFTISFPELKNVNDDGLAEDDA